MIGLKKLAPIFHPIRSTTSCGLSIHIFLHFTSAMCKYFEFWMVHWIDCMPYAIGQRDYFVSVLCWQKARNRSLITSITNTLLIYSLVSSFTLGELFASENVQTLSAKKTSLHIFMPHRGSCFPRIPLKDQAISAISTSARDLFNHIQNNTMPYHVMRVFGNLFLPILLKCSVESTYSVNTSLFVPALLT